MWLYKEQSQVHMTGEFDRMWAYNFKQFLVPHFSKYLNHLYEQLLRFSVSYPKPVWSNSFDFHGLRD